MFAWSGSLIDAGQRASLADVPSAGEEPGRAIRKLLASGARPFVDDRRLGHFRLTGVPVGLMPVRHRIDGADRREQIDADMAGAPQALSCRMRACTRLASQALGKVLRTPCLIAHTRM
jgi:hypothetical protein